MPFKKGHAYNRLNFKPGTRFGLLTVLGPAPDYISPGGKNRETRWHCRCDCGKEISVISSQLKKQKSCGCKRERKTHGLKHTPEYQCWESMKSRCLNPNNKDYDIYGGRGISVCTEWKGFIQFYKDMGLRPNPGYSLDRIDNDGDYTPNNCRWATAKEQQRNRSNNKRIRFQGQTLVLSEWAEKTGLNYFTIYNRLKSGWPVERALTEPSAKRG